MLQHMGNIIQAACIAALMWTASTLQHVSETVAVHEWRIAAIEKARQ